MIGLIVLVVAIAIACIILKLRKKSPPRESFLTQDVIRLDRDNIRKYFLPKHQLYGVLNSSAIYCPDTNDYLILMRVSSFTFCDGDLKYEGPYHAVVYQGRFDTLTGRVKEISYVDLPYEKMMNCIDPTTKYQANNGVEDPRVFLMGGTKWGVGNVNGISTKYPCMPRMCLWKLSEPRESFTIIHPPPSFPVHTEKNWSPFEWNNKLYFEYSLNPRIIVESDIHTGESKVVSMLEKTNKYPKLHGGGVPIMIDLLYPERYYLNVAHLHEPEGFLFNRRENYLQCFYLFEPQFPFNIKKMTPLSKIGDVSTTIQFASCITYNTKTEKIVVSYGEDDCSSILASYNLSDILKKMRDV